MDDSMNNFDAIMTAIVAQVKTGKHPQREWLRNLNELDITRKIIYEDKCLVKTFKKMYRVMLKDYLKNRQKDIDDITLLLSCRTMRECIDYFKVEVDNFNLLIKEYKSYLNNGHLLDALIGKSRPDEDMVCNLKIKKPITSIEETTQEPLVDPFEED